MVPRWFKNGRKSKNGGFFGFDYTKKETPKRRRTGTRRPRTQHGHPEAEYADPRKFDNGLHAQ